MELEKTLDIACSLDRAIGVLGDDATLLGLFPSGETEITGRSGDRRTTRTHYRTLGREGVATFHFDLLLDGSLRFEKVCDGNVWRELRGLLSVEEARDEARSRLRLELSGRTKALVPEFTIKGPMGQQLDEMSSALQALLEAG